jgi:hypothetical protein
MLKGQCQQNLRRLRLHTKGLELVSYIFCASTPGVRFFKVYSKVVKIANDYARLEIKPTDYWSIRAFNFNLRREYSDTNNINTHWIIYRKKLSKMIFST